jgi:uncharacterized protein YceH (UPF0502 family)
VAQSRDDGSESRAHDRANTRQWAMDLEAQEAAAAALNSPRESNLNLHRELKAQVEKLTDQVTSLRTQITVLQNPQVFTNSATQKIDDRRD